MTSARSFSAGAAIAALTVSLLAIAPPASAEPGGIVISELHYHAGSDLDVDDFLELTNTAVAPIDVSGWSFTSGVTAVLPTGSVIPAGGYYVVAKDAVAFQTTWGFAPDAVYTGNLSNGGEAVALFDGVATIDQVTYTDQEPWPAAADGTGPSLELRGLLFDNTLPDNWGPSTTPGGTPRAENSLNGTAPPPRATQVVVVPTEPDPGQAVTVSARLPVGASADLVYKVMFGADQSVAFLDDAASPGGAGDGTFAGVIPGQTAGRLIRYRIEANSAGTDFTFPATGDTVNYEGVVVRNPAVTSTIPVFNWFMEDAVLNDILTNHRYDNVTGPAVLAYQGQVVDNVQMRVRGQSSRDEEKVSWKVDLPTGRVMSLPMFEYPLDEFALQRQTEPLADMAWETVEAGGEHGLGIGTARLQRNGVFYSVTRPMETMDGAWRDDKGVDDWAIYKGNDGSLSTLASAAQLEARVSTACPLCPAEQWLEKKSREDEDFTDVWQLTQAIDAPASAAQKEWLFSNINIPQVVNYLALTALVRHHDSNSRNWWVARDSEGTGRWEYWHWDMNWTFTTPASDGKGEFLYPGPSNRLTVALLADPEIKEMYHRRLRTLADEYLTPGRFEAQWDAETQPFEADWALDRAAWGGRSFSGARTNFLNGLADRRALIVNNTGPGRPIPASRSAAPVIVINEIQYAPTQGADAEFLELTNPSPVESVDLSGWTIPELGLTIAPGTVVLPGSRVVFVNNDAAFRTTYGPSNRFVGGEYADSLSDTGQTLTLRDGARTVDQVSYSATAPWPVEAAGTGPSLELVDPSSDNNDPANWTATSNTGGTPAKINSVTVGPDTTPPSAPGPVSTTDVSTSAVSLTWGAATDNRGVVAYRVVRNGTVLTSSATGTSYVDTTVAGSSSYLYTVQAIDAAGLVGPTTYPLTVNTPGGNPVLFSETFTGANGSTWGAGWTTTTANGSVTRQNNEGQLSINNVTGANARVQLTGAPTRRDGEAVFSYRWSATAPTSTFTAYLRGSGGWANNFRPNNGYGLEFTSGSTSVLTRRVANGTVTTLNTSTGAQQVGTAKQWVRLQAIGSTIRYRTWLDGQAEPATWRATVTDATVTAPGQFHTALVRSSGARNVFLDDLTVLEDPAIVNPDTSPPSAPGTPTASNITASGVTLNWAAATDDRGVTGYRVIRDGTQLPATPTGTSFTDSGLSAATDYVYEVRAVDAAGNLSDPSGQLSVTTASPPTGFNEPFTGADGTAWGANWTSTTTNGSVTRQANEGVLAFNDVANAYARTILTGIASSEGGDVTFSYRWSANSARGYFSVFLRGSGGWANGYRPSNGYGLEFSSNSTTVAIKRTVNGSSTALNNTSGAQQLSTTKQWVRLRVVGSTIQYKTWVDGQVEPATWRATITDATVTAPGQLFLSHVRSSNNVGGGKNVTIDDLNWTNGN